MTFEMANTHLAYPDLALDKQQNKLLECLLNDYYRLEEKTITAEFFWKIYPQCETSLAKRKFGSHSKKKLFKKEAKR